MGNEDIEEDPYEGMPEHMRHSDSARRGWKAGAKAAGKVFGKSEDA